MKSVGLMRKVKLRGREKLWWLFTFTAAAFNLGEFRSYRRRHVKTTSGGPIRVFQPLAEPIPSPSSR